MASQDVKGRFLNALRDLGGSAGNAVAVRVGIASAPSNASTVARSREAAGIFDGHGAAIAFDASEQPIKARPRLNWVRTAHRRIVKAPGLRVGRDCEALALFAVLIGTGVCGAGGLDATAFVRPFFSDFSVSLFCIRA